MTAFATASPILRTCYRQRGGPPKTQDATVQQNLSKVESALDNWEDDPAVRQQVVDLIRQLLPRDSADAEDASNLFFSLKPDALVSNLSRSLNPPPATPGTSAASLDPFAGTFRRRRWRSGRLPRCSRRTKRSASASVQFHDVLRDEIARGRCRGERRRAAD